MKDWYDRADNVDQVVTYCPKRNHIKPCWCGGVASCVAEVSERRCKRIVIGSAARCWQHRRKR